MQLIIDGRRAVLKAGSSFDFIVENRAFTEADSYSLAITLPLAGCQQNLDIFGHLDRFDIDSRQIILDAMLLDRNFAKGGVVTVVEATDIEIKVQFLEGRSARNFDTSFDNVYINEMELGSYPPYALTAAADQPKIFFKSIDEGAVAVAFPWVNDSADGFLNNEIESKNGSLYWASSTLNGLQALSFQPYLLPLTKKIFNSLGYTCDFSEWEQSGERHLVVCNTLPASWRISRFSRALPHWSVSEFIEELEKILVCEFEVDHLGRRISMAFTSVPELPSTPVGLENVVDTFSSEIAYDDDLCQFRGIANLRYADRGDEQWKLEQCQWLVDLIKANGRYYYEFDTYEEYTNWLSTNNLTEEEKYGSLIYLSYLDGYFTYKRYRDSNNQYVYNLVNLNRFGDRIIDEDSGNDVTISCVPARVDTTDFDHGPTLFLAPSGYNEQGSSGAEGEDETQLFTYATLMNGEQDGKPEYFDKLLLGYWEGIKTTPSSSHRPGLDTFWPIPSPEVDTRFSLQERYMSYLAGLKVNPREKLKVSWVDTTIPDVRAIFYIRGRRYMCEKITATFYETGMSRLLKGEFYPMEE